MAGLPDASEHPMAHDGLIVAHPLPFPGLDSLQRRLRALAVRERDAVHEAEALRRHLEQAGRRLEILVGREQVLAERVRDLRAQLLAAHARMVDRDAEIHKTFGDLAAERDALAAERDALARSLQAAEARLNIFRNSAVGHVYRAARKAIAQVRAGRESSGREGGAD
jgi:chromosome segregation ATPase